MKRASHGGSGIARPPEKMGGHKQIEMESHSFQSRFPVTPTGVRQVLQRIANAKRRRQDKESYHD